MTAEVSRSSASADSYIGSLISLTSKSEIRYEGVLYSINTVESSIGLKNVRSFGTEGRKKDGPQVPQSDKIYEFILFRGSDIKDLQVKASPPALASTPPPATSISNDPAIIQSHYPAAAAPPPVAAMNSTGMAGGGISENGLLHSAAHIGWNNHHSYYPPSATTTTASAGSSDGSSPFLSNLPLYPPGGNIVPWGSSPPLPLPLLNPNGSGIAMPMYWQGYYGLQNTQPSFAHQPLLRPPTIQQTQYGLDSLPPPPPLSTFPPEQLLPSLIPNMMVSLSPPMSKDPAVPATAAAAAPLVTPGQLMQSLSAAISSSLQDDDLHKDAPAPVRVSSPHPTAQPSSSLPSKEVQPPILPLPQPHSAQKFNGYGRGNYGGRQRNHHGGRGPAMQPQRGGRGMMKFTEDFDFTAMNERFNKDQVWGNLGKSKQADSDDDDDDDPQVLGDDDECVRDARPSSSIKPVGYNKDDFFDTISCNALDADGRGRVRFSEQLKVDTETFGSVSRYHHGNRWPPQGRSRGGGSGYYHHGRGGGGGGYYHARGAASRGRSSYYPRAPNY